MDGDGNSALQGCLTGVRVLDCTQFEAGPSCTEALAWLGAEVVKVENPKLGDPGRTAFGATKNGADSWYFLLFNANKKSIAVNLKSPSGLKLVKDLASKADVFIENFAPGAIERLGLGYDVLRALNPGLIYAQVKGFGEGSPYENNLAFDMIAQACGGVMSITGERNGKPRKPGPTLGDTGTGMLMAISVLGALYRRQATGQGQRLAVAMQDAMLHYIRVAFANTAISGKAAIRNGDKSISPPNPPCGIYPCKEGGPNDYVYIFTSRANPEHWKRLLQVIGREDLIGDPKFDTFQARAEREAMKLIGGAGIPAGALLDTLELQNDADFERRGIMQTMEHPAAGPFKMPTWPVRHDGKPLQIKPAPLLGQHNAEVLNDWLGMSDGDVEGLRKEGAI